jgi:general secretion pathway protein I
MNRQTRESRSVIFNAQSGFTLLEVLVATAILGTAVTALFSLLSGSLSNVERLRAPSRALMLAQSRMNELLSSGIDMPDGTSVPLPINQKIEGKWDDQFRWEAMATRYSPLPEVGQEPAAVVRIALNVYWKTAPSRPEKKLSLETYQLRQEPLEPLQ